MNLQQAEAECAAVAKAPRVSLRDIEAAVNARYDIMGHVAAGVAHAGENRGPSFTSHDPLALLSICILVMRNGFVIVGKSAPASPDNFNAELGRKLAYEDCIRQLWPLMGFALREKLAGFA